jgi:hypothetical protein
MGAPLTPVDVQTWAVGVTAVNALISAAVAIFGTSRAHTLTDRREQRKERVAAEEAHRAADRERIEQLVESLHEHMQEQRRQGMHLANLGVAAAYGGEIAPYTERGELSPFARALMLQQIYFPEWSAALLTVTQANHALATFWSDESAALAADPKQWFATSRPTYVEREGACHSALLAAVGHVITLARDRITELRSAAPQPVPPASAFYKAFAWARGLWSTS